MEVRGSIEVPTTTVDAAIERAGIRPEEVGLLWADAEGSEDRILLGATTTLEARPPVVLELNPLLIERSGGSVVALLRAAERHYSHFQVLDPSAPEGHGPRPIAELPGLSSALAGGTLEKKKLDLLFLPLN